MQIKPFIKWVGGKTQLLNSINQKYPNGLGKTIEKYCEPFIGGGAVLFDVLTKYKMKEVMINDINPELIITYQQIKTNVEKIIMKLYSIQNEYWNYDETQRKEYFAKSKQRFNEIKFLEDKKYDLEKATLFIFLNKTCFNGLYRVNKSGLYNVPIGGYKQPLICDEKNLKNVSIVLQNVIIKKGDYKECINFIDNHTFVYLDPPYRPITKTSAFTSYTSQNFNDTQQRELGEFVLEICSKGAKVLISNSDPKNTNGNDNFFDDIYSSLNITRVLAKRMINCNGKNRGDINELLMSNY